ncbi:deoxynucleoside kinase [Cupriavidus basilensis]
MNQRAQRLQTWQAALLAGQRMVADFLYTQEPSHAGLALPEDELALYDALAARLPAQGQRVDLVIVLQASPALLRERIARRNAPGESSIDEAYLERLSDAYGELFHRYDEAPVMIVDTAHFSPVDNDADFRTLLSRIENMRGRRPFSISLRPDRFPPASLNHNDNSRCREASARPDRAAYLAAKQTEGAKALPQGCRCADALSLDALRHCGRPDSRLSTGPTS